MYLVSAYFDDRTKQTLERYISRIAEKTGNSFMSEHHVPPHMTISSLEARNAEVLLAHASKLEAEICQGEIRFVSVGCFFPYVLYVTPVLNEYLQELSGRVYEAMSDIAEVTVSRFYQPMQWLPHVTLGKQLSGEQMREAFAIMQNNFAPFTGRITSIGLASVNPHEDVWRIKLDQSP